MKKYSHLILACVGAFVVGFWVGTLGMSGNNSRITHDLEICKIRLKGCESNLGLLEDNIKTYLKLSEKVHHARTVRQMPR